MPRALEIGIDEFCLFAGMDSEALRFAKEINKFLLLLFRHVIEPRDEHLAGRRAYLTIAHGR